ncbi:MAG: acetyl-CoA carboxylase biotin carboxyl carrier protein subunit [Gemmatimonadota bacterium]
MSGRSLTLALGEALYEVRLTGPDREGGISLLAKRAGAPDEKRSALELRARLARDGHELTLTTAGAVERLTVLRQGRGVWVGWRGRTAWVEPDVAGADKRGSPGARDDVRAPMTGTLQEIRVASGDRVARDDVLGILEAMKMEYRLLAPRDGEVADVPVRTGDRVELGQVMVRLRPLEPADRPDEATAPPRATPAGAP